MLIRKDVVKLAMPIITEQAFVKIMGVINAVMAGHLGKEAVSAIGMVDAINNIFISLFSALAVGGSVVVAHYAGRREAGSYNESARHALLSGEILAIAATLIIFLFRNPLIKALYGSAEPEVISNIFTYFNITLLTYPLIALTSIACGVLRGIGNTKTPMQINIIMNVMNVVLSYILIYGLRIGNAHIQFAVPGLGIKGASLGIALARTIGAVLVTYALFNGSNLIKIEMERKFRFDFGLLKSIYGIGFPASIESLLFTGGKLITQTFIVGMGTASIAANYVTNSVAGLICIPADALSISATIFVGQHMGRRDGEGARDILLYLVKAASLCLLGIGIVAYPLAGFLSSAYTDSKDVIEISSVLIRAYVVVIPFLYAVSFILPAGLKGAGDAKYTMTVSVFGMWAFRIVLGYIVGVTLKMGVLGVWIGMYVDWIVRGTLFYIRLLRGKWKENVVIRNANRTA